MIDASKTELEKEKMILRKIVAPNIGRWKQSSLIPGSYTNESVTNAFKYLLLKVDPDPKMSAGQLATYLAFVVEGQAKTYEERHEIRKQVKNVLPFDPDTISLRIETASTLANSHSKWNRRELLAVLSAVDKVEEYQSLVASFDFNKALQKAEEQKIRQKKYLQKRRVVRFSLSVQKKIANILVRRLITKTDNYLLKLLYDQVDAASADTSGQSLVDAAAILGLTRQEIANLLINSSSAHARRMVALFSDDSTISLLDKDEDVRVAARLKRTKQVEEQ